MTEAVLVKIIIYVAILFVGYLGKRLGAFKKEHTKFLNTVICYITLPAAIINGFVGVELTPILFISLGIGLFTNMLLLILGLLVSKNKSPIERVIYIFSTNCFNIGNFAIPFLTGLISSDGFAAICIFDISVALMCYGVNVAVANSIMSGEKKVKLLKIIKKVCTSPVFITYIIVIILSLFRIELPKLVMELTTVVGNANSFIAMLCIGILFQFKLNKQQCKVVCGLLTLRTLICIAISLLTYFFIPLPNDIKTALCVVLLAPCPGSAPALTESAGGDGSVAAVINSISIPLSIGLMTLFLTIL